MRHPAGSIVRDALLLIETVRVDEYLEYMRGTHRDAFLALDGNLETTIMTRALGDGRSEVRVLSTWRDEAAIRAFAGDGLEVALAYPDDDEYLLEPPPPAIHWLLR